MPSNAALLAHAASRFGLGGRPDQPLAGDPNAWLTGQLGRSSVAGPNLDTCLGYYAAFGAAPLGSAAKYAAAQVIYNLFQSEQQAYLVQAVTTTTPFLERLVRFWTNHFAVQAASVPTLAVAGTFVRDAIRANIAGTFSAMLQAAVQHPALVYSLSNSNSAGPASPVGIKGKAGFNENLGRETLELFTVGLAANYSQADVDAMAHLLTGVTVNLSTRPYGAVYNPSMAQPGSSTLLGTTYPNTHVGCVSALAALGTNPCTYLHLATKLATHFISDTPPAAAIASIAAALSSSGGSLMAAAQSIVAYAAAWTPLTKVRDQQDYLIALMRGAGVTSAAAPALCTLAAQLGEPVWQPPFPNGWSDLAGDWCGPASLDARFRLAAAFGGTLAVENANAVAAATIGPLLSANTEIAFAAAPDTMTKITVLFASPEFQRR